MNALRFANRLTRKSTVASLATARADQLEDIADSINAAIYEFYRLAPERFRRTTFSGLLQAPRTITATVTDNSAVLTGSPFASSDRGKACRVAGDSKINEIVSENQLLHAVVGVSGAVEITIYSNCLRIEEAFLEKVVTHPREIGSGQQITPDEGRKARYYQYMDSCSGGVVALGNELECYWVEHTGFAAGANDVFQMKFLPFPVRDLIVEFDALIFPLEITASDITDETEIAVPDAYVIPYLLPLAERQLMDTATGDQTFAARADNRAEKAEAEVKNISQVTTPPMRQTVREMPRGRYPNIGTLRNA